MAEKFRRPKCQAPAYGFRIGKQCGRPAVWTIRNAFASDANGRRVCDDWSCMSALTHGYPYEARRIESPSETAARLAEQNA